nr:MAG TPA: PROTEIN/RNA Complex, archaeal, ribosomal, 50S, protein.0A [Caudoviricetes sp.]
MFCANERNGPNCSDECYKMATTDALSVAAKALGVGADIYWQADSTKYTTDAAPAQQQGKAKKPVCAKCGRPLQGLQFKNGQTITLEQAQIKFDGLCYSCWKKQQAAQKEAQA